METYPHLIRRLHNDLFWVGLRNDGIMQVQIRPNLEIEIEHIKKIVDKIQLVGAGKKYPLLIIAGEFTLPTAEAREYLATAESDPYAIAEAYVIHSFSQRLVGNVYLRLNKPSRPTKLFNTEEKAMEWLQDYLQHE